MISVLSVLQTLQKAKTIQDSLTSHRPVRSHFLFYSSQVFLVAINVACLKVANVDSI